MAIARPARLHKNRHGVYSFRWIVPARLRDEQGRPREIRVSLGTRDPRQARILGLQVNLACEGLPSTGTTLDLRQLVQHLAAQTTQASPHILPIPISTPSLASADATGQHTPSRQAHPATAQSIRAFVDDYLESRIGLARNSASTRDEKARTLECLLCYLHRGKKLDIAKVGIHELRRSWLIDFVDFYAQHGAITNDEVWDCVVEGHGPATKSKGGRPVKGEIAARTVVKAIGHISDLCTYGTATEALAANPIDQEFRAALRGVWDDAAAARRHAGYRPFSAAQMKAIFDPVQLLHMNSAADYFWSPLLGAFTAARLGELVTLSLEDVFTDPSSGVLVLRIRDDQQTGRRVKNHNSERLVPVCHRLMEIGFGDYVEHVRRLGAAMLFPHLKPGATRTTDPSKAQSRQFARYLDHLGIRDEQHVFHSFRHTAITTMHGRGVPLMDSELIAGHAAQALAQSADSTQRGLRGWSATQPATYIHARAFEEAGEPLLRRLLRHMDAALDYDLDYVGLRAAADIVRLNTIATGIGNQKTFRSGWHTNAKAYSNEMMARLRQAVASAPRTE